MPNSVHIKQFFLSSYAKRVARGRKDFFIEWTLDHAKRKDKQGIIAFEGLDVEASKKISFASLSKSNKDELFTDTIETDTEFKVRFYSVKESSKFFTYLKAGLAAAMSVVVGTYFTVQTSGLSLAIAASGAKEIISGLLKREKSKEDKEIELGYGSIFGEELMQSGLHVIKIYAHERIFIERVERYNSELNEIETIDRHLKGGMPMAAIEIEVD